MKEKDTPAGLTQSVARALMILKCFTDREPQRRVSDISAQLELTPSLVSRLLSTLEHEGFVERSEDTNFYRVGKGIITLAGVALNHNRLRMEALDEMQQVIKRLKLGINLAVLDDDSLFYLAHIDGPDAPRAYTLIGRRNPLHATGMGKVLLAYLPTEARSACLKRLTFYPYTTHTLTDSDLLEKELTAVRKRGWALELEELALGRACIAGPIRNQQGSVVAALSISGPLSTLRWEERKDELIAAIIETTDRISMRLGYITAPRMQEGEWRPPKRSPGQYRGRRMKIRKVEAIAVRIKRDEAYLGALPTDVDTGRYFQRPPYRALYSAYFETTFVKITTDDGLIGWGEALAPVAPEVSATIIEQLLSPVLENKDPLATGFLWSTMYDLMRERGYYGGFMLDAISACDIALWDLKGKYLDQPVYKLLGGPYRDEIPCYVSGLPKPTDKERVALAEGWAEQNFWAFKLAAGNGVNADAASVAALRESLGDRATLLLDAHWVYTLDEAVTLGRKLETLEAAVLEAPMNPEDVTGHARLADALALSVAIGETERSRYQFRPWLEQRAADLLQPDVGRTGISELMKIASMAEAFNLLVAPHLSVHHGIGIAASIHVAAAIPNLYLLEFQPPVFELANTFLKDPILCQEGKYWLDDRPGLGTELDQERLSAAQA